MQKRSVGIAISYVEKVINMMCGLFLSSFLLRSLGDTEYGIYKSISSFVNYLVLLEFGTGTVMTRNISLCKGRGASQEEIDKNISTVWGITGALSVLIFTVSVGFFFSLDFIYKKTMTPEQINYGKLMFVFIVAYLLLSFISQTLDGITLAYKQYTFASKISIARNIIRAGLLACLISAWKISLIIAVVDALISLVIAILKYFYCKKKLNAKFGFKKFDKLVFKSVLPLCLAMLLQSLIAQANNNVDQFIIGIKINPETVSLYSVALYIYSVFSSFMMIPINMYVPQVTENVGKGMDSDELTKTLIQPSRLVVIIGGAIVFGFVCVGRPFISIVYGEEYLSAWLIAIILMFPTFISMTNAVSVNVLNAMNKRLARSLILTATTILNIILTIIWIDKFGIIGAPIATAISTIIGPVILSCVHYRKCIKLNVFKIYQGAYKGILPWLVVACVSGLLISSAISNEYLSLVVGGLVFVFMFFALFLLKGANNTEKQMINGIITKIKGILEKNDKN